MTILEERTEQLAPAPVDARRSRMRMASRLTGYASVVAGVTWIISISFQRGRALQRLHPEVLLGAAPLVGRDPHDGWDWRFGFGLLGAGLVALVLVIAVAVGWFDRVRLRVVVLSCSLAAIAFSLMLALTDRSDGVLNGVAHPTEYLTTLPKTPPAGEFVRTFLDQIDRYSVHVRGHPPGFVLVLKAMAAVGLDGPWAVALLSVLSTGVLVAAVLTTVWAVAGAAWVRRCAPFMVVAPYAVWQVTSADSFFTAVGALGVALVAVGLCWRSWTALLAGLAGGLLLGSLIYLTYLGLIFGLVPFVIVVAALVARRPGGRVVLCGAAVGAAIVVCGFWLAGFWWVDGARRTRTEYWEGTAQFREWGYFKFANIAVLLIAIGPATIAGLLRLRDRRMWTLVASGIVTVVASHFSQYTRGEVERIWLLFFPWLVIAGGALAVRSSHRSAASWLGLQAACAIVLQAALVSKW